VEQSHAAQLIQRLENHTARIGVVGLGYVGLPFLVEKAKVGFHVVGIDRNARRAEMVARGENYIGDVRDEDMRDVVAQGLVTTTTDFGVVADLEVIVICVPTPLDINLSPDLSYVKGVTTEIARYLRPGQLVSLESTTYPGTTEEVMKPLLEAGGLRTGEDFFLAHSPEWVHFIPFKPNNPDLGYAVHSLNIEHVHFSFNQLYRNPETIGDVSW